MRLISAIFEVLAALVKWLLSPRRLAKRDTAQREADIQAGTDAIRKGDEDEVNRRLKRVLRTVVATAALAALATACAARTQVIYVGADEKAVALVHGGVKGWFLPDAVFAMLLEKAERASDKARAQEAQP